MTLTFPTLALLATAAAAAVGGQDSLPVAPAAEDLVTSASQSEARVEFDVKEPYPAPETVSFLVQTMERRGWTIVQLGNLQLVAGKPLGNDPVAAPLTPEMVGAVKQKLQKRGWSDGFVPAPVGSARSWKGRWLNAAGEEITYTLAYNCRADYGLQCVLRKYCGGTNG